MKTFLAFTGVLMVLGAAAVPVTVLATVGAPCTGPSSCGTGESCDAGTSKCVAAAQPGTPGVGQAVGGAAGSPSGSGSFVPLSNIPKLTEAGNAANLSTFLNALYRICIGIAVVIAVLQLIRAGILYMTAAGNMGSTEKARHLIVASLLGLILVLSPYIVFSVINPAILSLNINTGELQGAQGGDALSSMLNTIQNAANQTCQNAGGTPSYNQGTGGAWSYSCSGVVSNDSQAAMQAMQNAKQQCEGYGGTFTETKTGTSSTFTCERKADNPPPQQSGYKWKGQFGCTNPSNPGGPGANKILQGGPFTTQAECYRSAGNTPNCTLNQPPGYTCTCDKPASEQGTACN
jgi:hypothetical protein